MLSKSSDLKLIDCWITNFAWINSIKITFLYFVLHNTFCKQVLQNRVLIRKHSMIWNLTFNFQLISAEHLLGWNIIILSFNSMVEPKQYHVNTRRTVSKQNWFFPAVFNTKNTFNSGLRASIGRNYAFAVSWNVRKWCDEWNWNENVRISNPTLRFIWVSFSVVPKSRVSSITNWFTSLQMRFIAICFQLFYIMR